MPVQELATLRLPPAYLEKVRILLRRVVPEAEVWAYGSRVTGTGHEASDLDLVLRHPADLSAENSAFSELVEAFIESDLPIRVDLMDWARIPLEFQREIEKAYVVVQEGLCSD